MHKEKGPAGPASQEGRDEAGDIESAAVKKNKGAKREGTLLAAVSDDDFHVEKRFVSSRHAALEKLKADPKTKEAVEEKAREAMYADLAYLEERVTMAQAYVHEQIEPLEKRMEAAVARVADMMPGIERMDPAAWEDVKGRLSALKDEIATLFAESKKARPAFSDTGFNGPYPGERKLRHMTASLEGFVDEKFTKPNAVRAEIDPDEIKAIVGMLKQEAEGYDADDARREDCETYARKYQELADEYVKFRSETVSEALSNRKNEDVVAAIGAKAEQLRVLDDRIQNTTGYAFKGKLKAVIQPMADAVEGPIWAKVNERSEAGIQAAKQANKIDAEIRELEDKWFGKTLFRKRLNVLKDERAPLREVAKRAHNGILPEDSEIFGRIQVFRNLIK